MNPPTKTPTAPLNLGLNDGTYAPEACLEVMKRYDTRTAFRNYTDADNTPLRDAIARVDRVRPEHVFLRNGSGPILKQAFFHVVRKQILRSPRRIAKHLLSKSGFPIITPQFTYSKVPKKAAEGGLTLRFLSLSPHDGFRLDMGELRKTLHAGDAIVYIANPNNPTGRVLITRDELIPLLEAFPNSRFWIDEAYVHYVDPAEHTYVADLVTAYPNLIVTRTFSFAYGLAAARVGYLLSTPPLVQELEKSLTNYRIGMLAQDLCVAALNDEEHLPYVREKTRAAVEQIADRVAQWDGVQTFPTQANFVFCRFTDGRRAAPMVEALARKNVLIKKFDPVADQRYDEYFRLTVGLESENELMLDAIESVLASP